MCSDKTDIEFSTPLCMATSLNNDVQIWGTLLCMHGVGKDTCKA